MKTTGLGVSNGKRTVALLLTGLGWLALPSCSSGDNGPREDVGAMRAAIVVLEPTTAVETGSPSPRQPTCPGNTLPDQCGSWAGVELTASRSAGKHPQEAASDVSHCLCQGIDFQIPAVLPVVLGHSGWSWDKPLFSFRAVSGVTVSCRYRGNGTPKAGGNAYTLDSCSDGSKAGQSAHGDFFQLALDDQHPLGEAVAVSLRLGEPDVVDGVVQEQVFYAHDPRIAGAALHVPRGAAPAFETFSLNIVPQVPPGTTIENGGDLTNSLSYAVDVHSNSSSNFVFTPVPGACPRVELPYDQATFDSILGPGRESGLRAQLLTSLTGVDTGAPVLLPLGAVTVNLTQHTASFCVEHLSYYLLGDNGDDSALAGATIALKDAAGVAQQPIDLTQNLPALVAGQDYELKLSFTNIGTTDWISLGQVRLVPVTIPTAGGQPTALLSSPWNAPLNTSAFTPTPVKDPMDSGSLHYATAEFTLAIKTPSSPTPLNFCLRRGNSPFFGACFTWDLDASSAPGATAPALCVPSAEVCNGKDDDCDFEVDEEPPTYYPDHDGDHYADLSKPFTGCDPPSGYILNPGTPADCCDLDARANAGQKRLFDSADSCGDFDYNCDGSATKGEEHVGGQCLDGLFHCGQNGWQFEVPECGGEAPLEECSFPLFTCVLRTVTARQACN